MMQPANLLVVLGLGIAAIFTIACSQLQLQEGDSFDAEPKIEVRASTARIEQRKVSTHTESSVESDIEPSVPAARLHPVRVRQPQGPPRVEMMVDGPGGGMGQVACPTCHSVRQPNFENTHSSTLDEFHQGLKVDHGKLACYACHNPDDTDSLRTADGARIAFQDVMTLCSQCHSPQAASFARGAHGGMNGFWDLSRGPRIRNNCIDCHDPHSPRFPRMIVEFKPRDRFLEAGDSHGEHE